MVSLDKKKLYNEKNFSFINQKTTDVDINIFNYDNFSQVVISDYAMVNDYVNKMQMLDINNQIKISNNILWNSEKQMINKGIYFVITVGSKVYNLLFNQDIIKIDERYQNVDGTTEERIITIYGNKKRVCYFIYKHDIYGSTYNIKHYDSCEEQYVASSMLSKEEMFNELSILLSNLKNIFEIDKIVNVSLLERVIFNDLLDDDYFDAISQINSCNESIEVRKR